MENRTKFQVRMAEIHQYILRMGALVEDALRRALGAIKNHDIELARTVIDHDPVIDDYQSRIEDLCVVTLATTQPVAADLRQVVAVIKIVSDLERIGDHARHVAKAVHLVSEASLRRVMPHLEPMIQLGIAMVHGALSALPELDEKQALAIASMDTTMDQMNKALHGELITMMKSNPNLIEEATTLVFINRFLERLGDHVTTMCDWIQYARTGLHRE